VLALHRLRPAFGGVPNVRAKPIVGFGLCQVGDWISWLFANVMKSADDRRDSRARLDLERRARISSESR
jgi:hypothetical protein